MFKSFDKPENIQLLDREPFKFKHRLMGHPALSIESLTKALPELAPHQVMYSKGLTDLGINFDKAHIEHKNGLTLTETIENIRTSNSYIAVKNPEVHPSFHGLFNDLVDDVSQLMQIRGSGKRAMEPMFWMFIASPNAFTPFHFDRYSNFLMQFRGSKEVAVFPPMHEEVISAEDCEAYIDRTEQRPPWDESKDKFATKFHFTPGEMIHIPFVSGHYVKNGPEDVSISLSFFFHNDHTMQSTRALQLNHRLRRRMKMMGMKPTPVGIHPSLDRIKAEVLPMANGVGRFMGKLRNR